MEIFAYIMAGIMVLTAGLMVFFAKRKAKWEYITTYEASENTAYYGALENIMVGLIILEIMTLFVVSIVCAILKAIN